MHHHQQHHLSQLQLPLPIPPTTTLQQQLSIFRGGSGNGESVIERENTNLTTTTNDGLEENPTKNEKWDTTIGTTTSAPLPPIGSTIPSTLQKDTRERYHFHPKKDESTTTKQQQQQQGSSSSNIEELRIQGKQLFVMGKFQDAATKFANAASQSLWKLDPQQSDKNKNENTNSDSDPVEAWATFRLHEALCWHKATDYERAIAVCDSVLEPPPPPPNNVQPTESTETTRMQQQQQQEPSSNLLSPIQSTAIRARAGLRRAKARLALGQYEMALHDARTAAFLGDRKAVTLYGQLMRQHPNHGNTNSMCENNNNNNHSNTNESDNNMWMNQDIFNNKNAALLESLMSKATPTKSHGESVPGSFLPTSFLQGLTRNNKSDPTSSTTMLKSVLQSISKQLDDTATLERICNSLQQCNAPILQGMAGMAGVSLPMHQAAQITNLAHSVTPQRLQYWHRIVKRILYMMQLLQKISLILQKYRPWILIWILSIWVKSAIQRPIPLSRKHLSALSKQQRNQKSTKKTTATTGSLQKSNATPPRSSPLVGVPVLLQHR